MFLHFLKTDAAFRACRVKSNCLWAGMQVLQGLALVFVFSLSTITVPQQQMVAHYGQLSAI